MCKIIFIKKILKGQKFIVKKKSKKEIQKNPCNHQKTLAINDKRKRKRVEKFVTKISLKKRKKNTKNR